MHQIILAKAEQVFNFLKDIWESQRMSKIISYTLVTVFVSGIIISYFDRRNIITLGAWDAFFVNTFFAIEISFTLLLIVELLSLIFVLPKSVSKSVGKQFELLSLIFVRNGFKEFSHIKEFQWETLPPEVYMMFAYAFGALALFVIMGFNSKLQLHSRLTSKEDDEVKFIQAKKLLALILIISFLVIGYTDVSTLLTTGKYLHSFDTFYSVLIFSDIIIVLIALRYTLNYYRIFRYSAFVLATIFIRISLSVGVFYNVGIGVLAAIFVLLLTLSYNHFLKTLPKKIVQG